MVASIAANRGRSGRCVPGARDRGAKRGSGKIAHGRRLDRVGLVLIWIAVSFLIWGIWPLRFIGVGGPEWNAAWPQDIALFPWGIVIALPLLWLSRGDEDMLMAAGSFGTPHLFPYHFTLLMPALARMGRRWAILSGQLAWTPLLANYSGPMAWHLGNLTSVSIWFGLYQARRSATRRLPGQWEILSNA